MLFADGFPGTVCFVGDSCILMSLDFYPNLNLRFSFRGWSSRDHWATSRPHQSSPRQVTTQRNDHQLSSVFCYLQLTEPVNGSGGFLGQFKGSPYFYRTYAVNMSALQVTRCFFTVKLLQIVMIRQSSTGSSMAPSLKTRSAVKDWQNQRSEYYLHRAYNFSLLSAAVNTQLCILVFKWF